MPEYTENQKKAKLDYMKRIGRLYVTVQPEEKKQIQSHAAASGMSVNAYIKQAIDEKIGRDLYGAV